MNFKKFFSKTGNTNYIYVILIIGVAVMILSSAPKKEKQKTVDEKSYTVSEEEKLSHILSQIEGVGETKVMITYFGSSEKSLAFETKTDKKAQTQIGFGGESTDKKAVMSGGEPMIIKEIYPEVKGVVIIADGANNLQTKEQIINAVSTLMGVAVHRICVLPKSE